MLVQIDWVLRRIYSHGKYKYRFVIGRFGGTLDTHMTFSQRWAFRQRFSFSRFLFHFLLLRCTSATWAFERSNFVVTDEMHVIVSSFQGPWYMFV